MFPCPMTRWSQQLPTLTDKKLSEMGFCPASDVHPFLQQTVRLLTLAIPSVSSVFNGQLN